MIDCYFSLQFFCYACFYIGCGATLCINSVKFEDDEKNFYSKDPMKNYIIFISVVIFLIHLMSWTPVTFLSSTLSGYAWRYQKFM